MTVQPAKSEAEAGIPPKAIDEQPSLVYRDPSKPRWTPKTS